ncbi:hypothetical protein QFC21_002494 [Naganishia friedmannii]|uniref:Uncharacterized protein n=1 Tax=Naganishia friedmannii TaxID=89922 RepID=A0ACC2VUR0_9TREE|nr:hypothetical protein QFC21_002494 [Naganishia friedmannii]
MDGPLNHDGASVFALDESGNATRPLPTGFDALRELQLSLGALRLHYELLLDYVHEWEKPDQPRRRGWTQAEANSYWLNRSLGDPTVDPTIFSQNDAERASASHPLHISKYCTDLQAKIQRNPQVNPVALVYVRGQLELVLQYLIKPATPDPASSRLSLETTAYDQPSGPDASGQPASEASQAGNITTSSTAELCFAAFPNTPPSDVFSQTGTYEPTLRGGPHRHPNDVSEDYATSLPPGPYGGSFCSTAVDAAALSGNVTSYRDTI